MSHVSSLRSALFVPGSRPERFSKAIASGADRVIVDLEDAVEEALKHQARDHLHHFLRSHPEASLVVRINAFGHRMHHQDLAFCASQPGVAAIMLPKAETSDDVLAVARTGKPVWALIESAIGLSNLAQVSAVKGLRLLTFGALDLAADLGMRASSPAAQRIFDQVRYQLLLNSVLHGLEQPLDTLFPALSDGEGLRRFAQQARDMGMGGMLALHPDQVPTINQAFIPSPEDIEQARRVVEASANAPGAFSLDGRMIDAPVISEARRIVACYGAAN